MCLLVLFELLIPFMSTVLIEGVADNFRFFRETIATVELPFFRKLFFEVWNILRNENLKNLDPVKLLTSSLLIKILVLETIFKESKSKLRHF